MYICYKYIASLFVCFTKALLMSEIVWVTSYLGDPSLSTESDWVAALGSLLWTSSPVNPQKPLGTCGHAQTCTEKVLRLYLKKVFELNFRAFLKVSLDVLLIGDVQVDRIDPLQKHRFLSCTRTIMPAGYSGKCTSWVLNQEINTILEHGFPL